MMKRLILHVMLNLSVFLGADLYVHDGANTRALLAELGDRVAVEANFNVIAIRSAIHRGIFSVERSVIRSRTGDRANG
jgi:hypothetical protein